MGAVPHRFTVEEYRLMGEAGIFSEDDRYRKLPLYAEARIPEAWIVDLNVDAIEMYSRPGPAGYEQSTRFRRGERIVSATLPDLIFDAAEALPPAE